MNYISLENIHAMLQRLIFNNYLPIEKRFDLIEDDRQFLINNLTMYPRQSSHPTYPSKTYFDSYKKYFIYGDSKKSITNEDIKITNIVGQSYGFMVDCAYIQNKKEYVEKTEPGKNGSSRTRGKDDGTDCNRSGTGCGDTIATPDAGVLS